VGRTLDFRDWLDHPSPTWFESDQIKITAVVDAAKAIDDAGRGKFIVVVCDHGWAGDGAPLCLGAFGWGGDPGRWDFEWASKKRPLDPDDSWTEETAAQVTPGDLFGSDPADYVSPKDGRVAAQHRVNVKCPVCGLALKATETTLAPILVAFNDHKVYRVSLALMNEAILSSGARRHADN